MPLNPKKTRLARLAEFLGSLYPFPKKVPETSVPAATSVPETPPVPAAPSVPAAKSAPRPKTLAPKAPVTEEEKNVFGLGSKITQPKPKPSDSDENLQKVVFNFDERCFEEFKKQCSKNRSTLAKNTFLQQCLTQDDINKLSGQSGDIQRLDDEIVARIFIAIFHTAGYTDEHIGIRPSSLIPTKNDDSLAKANQFANAWFKLRGTSDSVSNYIANDFLQSDQVNIDARVFGYNCQSIEDLQAKRDIAKEQLQSALDLLKDVKDVDGKTDVVKQSISSFIKKLETYPIASPTKEQIKEASIACEYANLVRATQSSKDNKLAVFMKPKLFCAEIEDQTPCELENFKQMVQDVVNATKKSIITKHGDDSFLHRQNEDAANLKVKLDITCPKSLQDICKKAGKLLGIENLLLVIKENSACYNMNNRKTLPECNATVGSNFTKKSLALEEKMRKAMSGILQTQLDNDFLVSFVVGNKPEKELGKAPVVNREEEKKERDETAKSTQQQKVAKRSAQQQTGETSTQQQKTVATRSAQQQKVVTQTNKEVGQAALPKKPEVVATALSPEKKVATQEEKGATQTNKEAEQVALPKNPEVVATQEEGVVTQEGEVARTQEVKKSDTKKHSSRFSSPGSTLQEEDQVRPAPTCGLFCCYTSKNDSVNKTR